MNSQVLVQDIEEINQQDSIHALEHGKILFYPDYYFTTLDQSLMTDSILDGHHKNVSFDYQRNTLGGYKKEVAGIDNKLHYFMKGYAEFAWQLIQNSLPSYIPHLKWGRTSFRPAQISGRVSSKRKDDTRVHVDSFSATPVNGLRILRVFCNINPHAEPRVWHVGEPFHKVLQRFEPQIPSYNRLTAQLLKLIKTTKTLRSAYDHYMLHLHDNMKLDDAYQAQVEKTQIDFPAQSSWIVYTDYVSHAALSGQYLLEQTFYLPADKMSDPEQSPYHQWQQVRSEV